MKTKGVSRIQVKQNQVAASEQNREAWSKLFRAGPDISTAGVVHIKVPPQFLGRVIREAEYTISASAPPNTTPPGVGAFTLSEDEKDVFAVVVASGQWLTNPHGDNQGWCGAGGNGVPEESSAPCEAPACEGCLVWYVRWTPDNAPVTGSYNAGYWTWDDETVLLTERGPYSFSANDDNYGDNQGALTIHVYFEKPHFQHIGFEIQIGTDAPVAIRADMNPSISVYWGNQTGNWIATGPGNIYGATSGGVIRLVPNEFMIFAQSDTPRAPLILDAFDLGTAKVNDTGICKAQTGLEPMVGNWKCVSIG